jgi:hypothetical protein
MTRSTRVAALAAAAAAAAATQRLTAYACYSMKGRNLYCTGGLQRLPQSA